MTISRCRRFAVSSASLAVVIVALALPCAAGAQAVTNRGFADGSAFAFPEETPNDATQLVGDLLIRDEVFVKPASWVQFAGGLDVRADSHHQVEDSWRVDFSDRGVQRPRISIRRLSATFTSHFVTLDVGKQFIRWGRADIVNPTDRFAPRDFLNVVDTEFLGVTGARAAAVLHDDTFEVVWVPRFTPSRVPLLDERWTVLPPRAAGIPVVDGGAPLPSGSQTGVRWNHVGSAAEWSLAFFDGFNHLPNVLAFVTPIAPPVAAPAVPLPIEIVVSRTYPSIRMYGGDAAVPTTWFTLKGETAYFTSSTPGTDEYVLYVVQLERQHGEWIFVGGYAGDAVTEARATLTFAPDRGMTRAVVGRASYTLDPNRSVAFETAVRQDGRGVYAKAEYSQAHGDHWRTTITAVGIGGHSDDFLGQYHRNSHVALGVRYSF